ncbi:restriction endonuclease subunit S [Proteus mirabilis]|uniref:restriction endonuclease subunit S n=1 Tax=Proteus mirabilis TaxID=584 RepID=UPI0018C5BAA9|nr:restriction endonuclease subunit S [Proteus mirabilis]MBG2742490.1 restriction endonuclease subunit S [Proteus mirabilis]MDF7208763.1 restriction endonuclease subunit S [Proteus mirabilis]
MGSEWPLVKLGEYCCKIGSGATPKGGSSVYLDAGDVCLIRSQNIYNDGFEEGGLVYIDEVAAAKLRNVIVEHNDILLNITGDSVARVCLVPDAYLPARVNQHVAIIRPNKEHFDARFLRYFLASPKTQILLLNLSSAGATRNALTKSMIENFEVPKPSLSVQVFIANILQILDDKIMKNRQINKTLEQMAQTLFKSWFVDFDPVVDNALDAGFFEQDLGFSEELLHRIEVRKAVRKSDNFKPLAEDIRRLFPNAFEECAEPALGLGGWVPSGWELGNLSDVTNILSGFAFKSNEFQNSGFGVIKIKNIGNDKSVDICDIQRIDISLAEKAKRFSLKDGDLLMAMTGATVGKFGFLVTENQEPYYLNQRVAKFEAIDESTAYLYCILNRKITESYIVNTAQGSAQPNISAKDILAMPLITAPQSIRELFNDKVNDSFQKIIQMRKQNIILEHLRDTLLPKLISGELSLSDIKIDIPEETLI